MTKPKPGTTDINLSWNSDSEAAQEIPWDQNAIVLSFADNGTLPAPAKIRIKMDYAFKDSVGTDNLYVYYYDNTNKEFVQVAANLVITDDDYLEFTITHNSDFVITAGELKKKEPENPDPEDPNKPEKPEDTGKEDTNKKDDKKEDTKKEDKKKTSPKTGDETSAAAAALPAGVSLAAILAVLVKKFK